MTGKGHSPKHDPAGQPTGPATPPLGGGIFDALEMTRQAWLKMAAPAGLAPAFDSAELERRLKDMRAVEQWLSMNLSMLRATIQVLETQHATMLALQSPGQPAPHGTAAGKDAPAGAPALDPAAQWQQLQEQFQRVALGALGTGAGTPPAPKKPAARSKAARK